MKTLVFALALMLPWTTGHAATIMWTNTAGGTWSAPGNWSPNQVPGPSDTAVITEAGTYNVTVNTSQTVSNLSMGAASGAQSLSLEAGTFTLNGTGTGNAQTVLNVSGGTFAGAGTWVSDGPLNWTGGTISGSAQFSGGSFGGGLYLTLYGGELINTGTLNWTNPSFADGLGSMISNAATGTLNLRGNLLPTPYGGTHTFYNAGQISASPSGTATLPESVNNTGAITVNSGTLNLSGGGANTGTITVAAQATLELSGGVFDFNHGSAVNGLGTNSFTGGTINFTGASSVTNVAWLLSGATLNFNGAGAISPPLLTMSGGTLAGGALLQVNGPLNWSGGTISGSAQFSGGNFSGGLYLTLYGGQLINTGALNWSDPSFAEGLGSMVSNAATGTISLTGNLLPTPYGGTHTFYNAGQISASPSGTATLPDLFNNTGAITVNSGTLDLAGGGTNAGPVTVASGATFDLGGGTFLFNTNSSISGAGNFGVSGATATLASALDATGTWTFSGGTANLEGVSAVNASAMIVSGGTVNFTGAGPWQAQSISISSGTLNGPVVVQDAGPLNWSGGTISGALQFNGGSFGGGLYLNLTGGQLVNAGTLNWSNPSFSDGLGSMISNAPTGTINLTGNLAATTFGGTRTFFNAGQISASPSGTATLPESLNNTGTITVNSGTLSLSGARSLAGGALNFGISGLTNYGRISLSGAAGLAGTLSATLGPGFAPVVGNSWPVLTYASSSGIFAGTNLPSDAAWQVNQGPTSVNITVEKLLPQLIWPEPAPVVYGTALTGTQLDAVAVWNGQQVPGVMSYLPSLNALLDASVNQTLSVAFTPSDPATYTNLTAQVQITVQPAPLSVTADSENKNYGQSLVFGGGSALFFTSGLQNGETIGSVTLAVNDNGGAASAPPGEYTITPSAATGGTFNASNYDIVYNPGALTVTFAAPELSIAFSNATVLTTNSTGNFMFASAPTVGPNPGSVAAFTNTDGSLDVACVDTGNNTLTVLTNRNGGAFGFGGSYPLASISYSMAAADVNGDGSVDLIVANYYANSLTIYTNDGSGGFGLASAPFAGAGYIRSVAAFTNLAGAVDLACANYEANTLTVLTNLGGGNFEIATSVSLGTSFHNPISITTADVNGDGAPDLIYSDWGVNGSGNSVAVFTNNGADGFASSGTYAAGNAPVYVTTADVNHDGNTDIITANYLGGTLTVLTNDGAGGFATLGVYGVGAVPYTVTAADINGDGYVDLLSANSGTNTVSALTNDGHGGFALASTLVVGAHPNMIALTDANNTGLMEMICTDSGTNTLTVLTGSTSISTNLWPSVVLSWPAGFPGYEIDRSYDLNGNNWVALTNSPTVTNGENLVLISPAIKNSFFRLRSP